MQPLEQLPIPLLLWYREHARVLPWRQDSTPYRVWVSEIMLQQTRVAAVLDYYRRFLQAAPTVQDLAALPEDALMKLWQGLGAVIVAAVGLGAQVLDFFHTGHIGVPPQVN